MRLEIRGRADLAVRALLVLDGVGGRVKGPDLAARLGTTPTYIPQVLKPLVKQGWVRSVPGPAGGYSCAIALAELSVLAVIEAVEGPTETERCVLTARRCDSHDPCALHGPWLTARTQLLASLSATPVAAIPAVVGSDAVLHPRSKEEVTVR